MLPELAQRYLLARYLSVMRDASVLPAWLSGGRDLWKMIGISIKQSIVAEIKMHISCITFVPLPAGSEVKSSQGEVSLPATNLGTLPQDDES